MSLRQEIEAFLLETGIPPTRFGRELFADPSLMRDIARGRIVRQGNARKIRAYMRSHADANRPEERVSLHEETAGVAQAERRVPQESTR